jgi:hypothetical protein
MCQDRFQARLFKFKATQRRALSSSRLQLLQAFQSLPFSLACQGRVPTQRGGRRYLRFTLPTQLVVFHLGSEDSTASAQLNILVVTIGKKEKQYEQTDRRIYITCKRNKTNISSRHIAVRKEDHCLQCVEFGGKIFVEVMLTFGGGNSPYKFNMPSSFLITLACLDSGLDPRQSIQQLDDNCACDSKGSWILGRYWICYRKIAEEIGVSLAGEENPSKAFGPNVKGEILGLMYNSEDWTWWIPKGKSYRLIVELEKVFEEG